MPFGDPPLPVGDHFDVVMHWRFFEETREVRVWAGFDAEVLMIDEGDMRFLVFLHQLTKLEVSHPPETLKKWILDTIRQQVGRYAFVPYESATGRTLFLKDGTLTGRNVYFFDPDSEKFPTEVKPISSSASDQKS